MRHKSHCFWKMVISVAITLIPFGNTPAYPLLANNNTAMESELDQALQDLVSMPGGPPGSIVLIQRGKKRYLYTAGVSNITSGRPIRPHDHMRIASVSKAFSGATALALFVANALEMDDTIGELLPDLPVEWHPVTLYQALNHTSGLPDYTGSPGFPELIMADPTHAPPPIDLLELVADRPLVFDPGSSYQYSNSDNIVVALMVEAVTGFDYAHVLRKKVLHPLRLRQTSLPAGVELPRPYVRGYDTETSGHFEDVSEVIAFGGYAWASGGIVSSPVDLGRFVRGYIGGRLFGVSKWVQQLNFVEDAASSPPGPGLNAAGIGLFRYRTRCGTVYGHTGTILGYTQFIAATSDGETSVVFSVNSLISARSMPTVMAALRNAQELAVCTAFDLDLKPKKPKKLKEDKKDPTLK